MRYLIRHQGETIARKSILEDVWGMSEDADTRAIDNFIGPFAAIYREERPG
jgi:DNA-binding response OmpR family regulator